MSTVPFDRPLSPYASQSVTMWATVRFRGAMAKPSSNARTTLVPWLTRSNAGGTDATADSPAETSASSASHQLDRRNPHRRRRRPNPHLHFTTEARPATSSATPWTPSKATGATSATSPARTSRRRALQPRAQPGLRRPRPPALDPEASGGPRAKSHSRNPNPPGGAPGTPAEASPSRTEGNQTAPSWSRSFVRWGAPPGPGGGGPVRGDLRDGKAPHLRRQPITSVLSGSNGKYCRLSRT